MACTVPPVDRKKEGGHLVSLGCVLDVIRRNIMFRPTQKLYTLTQVPHEFHEPYIFTGYRDPRSTFKMCIKSALEPTNETMNFWTHFLPSLVFWARALWLWNELDVLEVQRNVPIMVLLVTHGIFPFLPSMAHLFNTMSVRAHHLCYLMDYAGLSLWTVASAYAYKAYSFMPLLAASSFAKIYLYGASFNGIMSMFMSSQSRFVDDRGILCKALRTCGYSFPYLFDTAPIFYRMLFCEGSDCDSDSCFYIFRSFLWSVIATVLFTTHFPECSFPGKFDIIGHSHQLFHTFIIFATYDQYLAMYHDLQASQGRTDLPTPNLWFFLVTLIGILLLLVVFACKVCRVVPKDYMGIHVAGCCPTRRVVEFSEITINNNNIVNNNKDTFTTHEKQS